MFRFFSTSENNESFDSSRVNPAKNSSDKFEAIL